MEGDGGDLDEDDHTMDEPIPDKRRKKKKGKKASKSSSDEESEDEDLEESWGRGKSAYYSSNAAELDSDDEEANELEEQEAKRLQAKARDGMRDEDFGLLDVHDVTAGAEYVTPVAPFYSVTHKLDSDFVEAPVVLLPNIGQDKKSLLRHLEKTDPITLALARDWDDTARSLIRTREKLEKLQAEQPDALSLGMIHLHYRPRLLILKQSLATLEDLDFAASDSEDDDNEGLDGVDMWSDANELWGRGTDRNLEAGELDDLLRDAESATTFGEHRSRLAAAKRGTPTQEPPTKKRKTSKSKSQPVAPAFDLVEPEFPVSKKHASSSSHQPDDAQNMYGELSSLDHADATDKSARKKSLRFHTSKIETTNARRRVRGVVPWAAMTISRIERGAKIGRSDDAGEVTEDADGYYELVKRTSKAKKERKKTEHDESVAAARGLTPHRSKSVRNPRVKKRQKFEKAKKKIASQKAVYKGGLDASGGRYEGNGLVSPRSLKVFAFRNFVWQVDFSLMESPRASVCVTNAQEQDRGTGVASTSHLDSDPMSNISLDIERLRVEVEISEFVFARPTLPTKQVPAWNGEVHCTL
ncbi:Sas10 C-terminal domain-containing protein [Salix suchowensis]|nr:Sas10 C-terminal domain-containing protein [Salix suchowensis]